MGLLYSVEGVGRRWLGPSLCCCAPVLDNDTDEEYRRFVDSPLQAEPKCVDESPFVPPMRPQQASLPKRPSTSYSTSLAQWVSEGQTLMARVSTQASTKTRSWYAHSNRPSIGQPLDFRKVEGVDTQRRNSFRPLELSICLPDGRLSPLPDFGGDILEEGVSEIKMPQMAHVRPRNDSVASATDSTNFTIQRKPVPSILQSEHGQSIRSSVSISRSRPENQSREASHSRSTSVQSSPVVHNYRSFSPHRLSSIGSKTSANSSRPRANTEPRRLKVDIDEAISELNTIVEERRADALRSSGGSPTNTSPTSHVPAIAPSMKVHARSQTLSEIGSAFSLPLTAKPLPAIPQASSDEARPSTNPATDVQAAPAERPTTAPARQTSALKPKVPLLVSVDASHDNATAAAAARMSPGQIEDSPVIPLSGFGAGSASLSHRLSAWLRRSMPSTPSTATTTMTSSTLTAGTVQPAKTPAAPTASSTISRPATPSAAPPLPPLPAQQDHRDVTSTSTSTMSGPSTPVQRPAATTYPSSSTFSSPSSRSTPSLISNTSSLSLSTLTPDRPNKLVDELGGAPGYTNTTTRPRTNTTLAEKRSSPPGPPHHHQKVFAEPTSPLPLRRTVRNLPVRKLAAVATSVPLDPPAYEEIAAQPATPIGAVVGLAL